MTPMNFQLHQIAQTALDEHGHGDLKKITEAVKAQVMSDPALLDRLLDAELTRAVEEEYAKIDAAASSSV